MMSASASTRDWQPTLLEPSQRGDIRLLIEHLLNRTRAQVQRDDLPAHTLAEIGLFGAYADRIGMPDAEELCLEALERAVAALQQAPGLDGLLGGSLEVGWILRHLSDLVLQLDHDALAPFTTLARGGLSGPGWDLASGSVGALHYLARGAEPIATEHLLEALEGDIAGWHDGGCPTDLGMAHGIAGTVAVLARLAPTFPRAEKLAQAAVSALLSCALPHGSESHFSCMAGSAVASRAAWCYGDPGIAVALWNAGRSLSADSLCRRAVDMMEHVSLRSVDGCGVRDASLCHGAAGLAHIFSRFHRVTQRSAFAAAARRWLDLVVALAPARAEDPTLATGTCGAGLVLIAALDDLAPAWDELFLIDID